jgi:hypothetical protein
MSNLEESIKVLNYHTLVRRMYWFVFIGLISAELLIIRLHIYKIMEVSFFEALAKIIVLSTVVISIFFRLVVFVRPRVFSKYKLYDNRVEIFFKNKKKEVLFQHIEALKFSLLSPRFFGGFSVILNTGQKFMFLSILNGSHEILEKLLKIKPELVKDKKLKSYVKRASSVEFSWQRIKTKMRNTRFMLAKFMGAPLVLMLVIFFGTSFIESLVPVYLRVVSIFGITFIITCTLAIILNVVEEHFVLDKLVHNDESDEVFFEFSRNAELATQISFYAITLVLAVLFYFVL